jgi:hypothetical protein
MNYNKFESNSSKESSSEQENKTKFSKKLLYGITATAATLMLMTGCGDNSEKDTSDSEPKTEQSSKDMNPEDEVKYENYDTLKVYGDIERKDLSDDVIEYIDQLPGSNDTLNLILNNLDSKEQKDKQSIINLFESLVSGEETEKAAQEFISNYKIEGLTAEEQEKYNALLNMTPESFFDRESVSLESMEWFVDTTLNESRKRLEAKGEDFSYYDQIISDKDKRGYYAEDAVGIENMHLKIALNAGIFEVDGKTINLSEEMTKKVWSEGAFFSPLSQAYNGGVLDKISSSWSTLVDEIDNNEEYNNDGMINFGLKYNSSTQFLENSDESKLYGTALSKIQRLDNAFATYSSEEVNNLENGNYMIKVSADGTIQGVDFPEKTKF